MVVSAGVSPDARSSTRVGDAGLGAVDLEEHVIADGIDEGAEGFGIFDAGLAEGLEDAKKSFLDDILDQLRGTQTRTQLDGQQFAEVRDEIAFGFGVGMMSRCT